MGVMDFGRINTKHRKNIRRALDDDELDEKTKNLLALEKVPILFSQQKMTFLYRFVFLLCKIWINTISGLQFKVVCFFSGPRRNARSALRSGGLLLEWMVAALLSNLNAIPNAFHMLMKNLSCVMTTLQLRAMCWTKHDRKMKKLFVLHPLFLATYDPIRLVAINLHFHI